MAGRYRLPEYLKPYPRTHAIITFAEPVPGPVALGGGRHVGLGVMAVVVA
jgi:CRISPR-associated protein Csb2